MQQTLVGSLAAVAAAMIIAACGAVGDEPLESFQTLEEYPERVFAATAWDTVAAFGPETADDTIFYTPTGLTEFEGLLVVPEWPHALVRAFTMEGEPLWTYGRRGGGPGELEHIVAVEPTPWGTLWVMDGKNMKIAEIDTTGTLVRERDLRHLPVVPGSLMFLGQDRVLFQTQSPLTGRIVTGTDSLEVLSTAPFLWADSVDNRYNITVATASDHRSGRWVNALVYGPGFATGVGDSVTGSHRYIDAVPWALKSGPHVRAAGADTARYGALDLAVLARKSTPGSAVVRSARRTRPNPRS